MHSWSSTHGRETADISTNGRNGASRALFGSPQLARVLLDVPMTALDIGARHGFCQDILPLAPAVTGIGFEPDEEECLRLNQRFAHDGRPWRALRFVPVALGPVEGERTLHLYRQRGTSSLLEALTETAAQFTRRDYYILDGKVPVRVRPLDEVAAEYGFADAVFMKIDVQGAELEVFEGAQRLLSEALLAVRSEVTFHPIYKDQPLVEDLIRYLRTRKFLPMGFIELHHWRRTTRIKQPRLARGPLPYSRGQLIHGDILFLRDPESLPDQPQVLIKAALLALAYGFVDHAAALLQRPAAAQQLREAWGIADPMPALSAASRYHAARDNADRRRRSVADLKFRVREALPFARRRATQDE